MCRKALLVVHRRARAPRHIPRLPAHMLTHTRCISGGLTIFVMAKRALPRLLERCRRVRVDGHELAPYLTGAGRDERHGVAIAASHYRGLLSLH